MQSHTQHRMLLGCTWRLDITTNTHLHIDSPGQASWDAEGLSSVRILHVAEEQKVKEEPTNHLHQLLMAHLLTLMY